MIILYPFLHLSYICILLFYRFECTVIGVGAVHMAHSSSAAISYQYASSRHDKVIAQVLSTLAESSKNAQIDGSETKK